MGDAVVGLLEIRSGLVKTGTHGDVPIVCWAVGVPIS